MKAKKINILLVDDNEKFLKSVAERTRLKGFNVLTATNGQQALEIAKKQQIHVAVVDQKMPDMEGLVVITKLKSLMPDIKTILLTVSQSAQRTLMGPATPCLLIWNWLAKSRWVTRLNPRWSRDSV